MGAYSQRTTWSPRMVSLSGCRTQLIVVEQVFVAETNRAAAR